LPLAAIAFSFVAGLEIACGEGGLVHAPALPSGAKFAVIPAPEDAGTDAQTARRPTTSPLHEGDVFNGNTNCSSGQVRVKLSVIELDGDSVNGEIELSSPRGTAHGSYKVTGTYTTQTRRLKLEAGDWVEESDELETSDLEGTLMDTRLVGRLAGPGCGSISMTRESK
jgi:hypothetical protein